MLAKDDRQHLTPRSGSHSSGMDGASAPGEGKRRRLPHRIAGLSPAGVGLAFFVLAFGVIEFLHRMLVPEIGQRDERLLAAGLSAVVLGIIAARLAGYTQEMRRISVARLEIIAEMNHHIRNALQVVAYSCHPNAMGREEMEMIRESVRRIDWALREILPRLPSDRGLVNHDIKDPRPLARR